MKIVQVHTLAAKVHTYLSEFDVLQARLSVRRVGPELWQPPKDTWLKINFDVAFCAREG